MYSCVASCLRQNLFNHLLIQQLRIGPHWHWARHKCNPCVRNVSNVRGKWELIGQWRRGSPVNYSSKFKQLSPNLEGMRKVILYELKKKKGGGVAGLRRWSREVLPEEETLESWRLHGIRHWAGKAFPSEWAMQARDLHEARSRNGREAGEARGNGSGRKVVEIGGKCCRTPDCAGPSVGCMEKA